MIDNRKPKQFACFTPEQQEYFNKLKATMRAYIEYRGQNYSKAESYRMAGYEGKRNAQSAYNMESRYPRMRELIEVLQTTRRARQIETENSKLNKKIDALAKQKGAERLLEVVDNADGETARRIQFYRDIIDGKIKTKRTTKKIDKNGNIVERKVEEVSDIEAKMKARKELDRLLGLNSVIDIDNLKVGDITINIVDAGKQEELQDPRNSVALDESQFSVSDPDDSEDEDEDGATSKQKEFYEIVSEGEDNGKDSVGE